MHCSSRTSAGPTLAWWGMLWLGLSAGCDAPRVANAVPDMERVVALRDAWGGGGTAEGSTDAADSAASGPQPTGWAKLKGRFRIAGQPPQRLNLRINKDTAICAPAGKQLLSEDVITGPDNGVKNVVVFLSQKIPGAAPWTHPDAAPGKTDEVVFDQKECIFLSHVLPMQTSQRLRILNSDPVGHNTKLSPKKNASFDRTVAAGGAALYQPTAEENAPFPVACAIHPWMNAWVMVRDNSYVAVTDESGAFEIPNLPTGVELEFRVWQEKANFLQDVTVNGESTTWKKGRVVLALDPEDLSQNDLDVTVDASIFN